MTEQRNLIFIGWNRWDTIWQRSHHLAQSFSRTFRVLYVDPVAYSLPGYLYHRLKGNRSRNFWPALRSINKNLSVFTPPPLLPLSLDNNFINRIDHTLLAQMVNRIVRQLDIQNPILWTTYPAHAPVANKFKASLVCYDCMDNYPAFYPAGSNRARLAAQQEAQLLAASGCVMATASSLQRRLSGVHPHVYLVRNAVGERFLTYNKSSQPPPDWPAGDGPVIGYMGSIARWLDFEAISQIACQHPNWRIVFIGPVEVDLTPYATLPNLYFLGPKPYDILADYVSLFDVGLIPFILNDLTQDVNPVKVYEYFALGLPVVATALPELMLHADSCYLAHNTTEFVSQVEQAVADLQASDAAALQQAATQRRLIAEANTWTARTAEIIDILEKHLEMKHV